MFYKIGLAIGVVLILTGTALISARSNTDPHLAYSLIALLAFGLELADGSTMGFVFILFALPQLDWLQTLLMASSAQMILIIVRRERPDSRTLLQTLAANAAAVLATQAVYHAPYLHRFEAPIRLMLCSGVCFLALRLLDVKKRDVWSFPYYPVAAAIAALFPLSAALPPLVYLTWRSCRLYERRLKKQRQHSREAASLHLRTIETLALAIEARDQPASRNPRRVQMYSVELAKALGLTGTAIEAVRAASLLYDIGEMAVPENIILKPGPLTPDEYEKVKIHPAVGAEILERVKFPYPVAPIVLAHHERWDGGGYPFGLSGESIPIGARILSVVDAFDALMSARHHRSAMGVEEALAHINSESGGAFDPRVVAMLRDRHHQWERLAVSEPARGFVESILSAQREVKVVMELTQKLGSSLELSDTFAAIKPALRALIPYDTLVVWIEREAALAAEFVAGDHLALCSTLRIPMGEGISGVVACKLKPEVNGDAALDMGHLGVESDLMPFRFALAAPLDSGAVRGALTLYRAGDQPFTPEDARVLSALAPKIAMAVANGLRFQKTTSQAATDSLTGLPNASALYARMEVALPSVVLICDLDGFKAVNDRFGHLTGNQLLEGLAAAFRKSCRSGDFIARMGGDEFVLLLEGIRPEEIGGRILQFRGLVRTVGREICKEDILDASFGAAVYPTDGTTANELLAFADRQMYRRKGEHRGGVRKIERSASA
jgi:diguanylate cyclase (GGDEF)-like protein